jgi:hypothetical protein
MKLKINKQIVGYTIYGILIFIALFYLRFPNDVVVNYITSTLSERNPNVMLSIDSIKPSLPPGLKANNLTLGFKDEADSTIQADMLTVRPGLLSLLKGKSTLIFYAITYGGTIEGNLALANLRSGEGPVNTEISFDSLNIDKCSYLTDKLGRQITGKFQGSLTYNIGNEGFAGSTGNLNFTILNGTYQLLESLLGFDKLDFSKIEGQMTLKSSVLKIDKLKLTGEKVRCSLKGNIVLNSNAIKSSQIDITCDVEIPGQSNKKMSILVSGTLGKPITKIM